MSSFKANILMVTASWMQLELKASMWLSSTKLTPHMLITLRLGVACFRLRMFRTSYT